MACLRSQRCPHRAGGPPHCTNSTPPNGVHPNRKAGKKSRPELIYVQDQPLDRGTTGAQAALRSLMTATRRSTPWPSEREVLTPTEARQASPRRLNFRVLVTSLLLALVAAAIVYVVVLFADP